jgi:hypothetical protein
MDPKVQTNKNIANNMPVTIIRINGRHVLVKRSCNIRGELYNPG